MFCKAKISNIEQNPQFLKTNFYGHGKKSIVECMICFQQAADTYLKYYKAHNMHLPQIN